MDKELTKSSMLDPDQINENNREFSKQKKALIKILKSDKWMTADDVIDSIDYERQGALEKYANKLIQKISPKDIKSFYEENGKIVTFFINGLNGTWQAFYNDETLENISIYWEMAELDHPIK